MDADWDPAAWALGYSGIVFDAKHMRDVGPGEVDVEDAYGVAGQREGEGELGRDGGFAHPAFAGEDLQEWKTWSAGLPTDIAVSFWKK